MKLVGASQQIVDHYLWRADGSIQIGGQPQLALASSQARSFLLLSNTSAGPLWFEIGFGTAVATIANGAVSSVAVLNAGFNYTKTPLVRFYGGGNSGNGGYLGLNQPLGPAPASTLGAGRPAAAHCVMSGSAGHLSISSIVIDDPGVGYVVAPYVAILPSDLDPYGCAVPSSGVGILIPSGAPPLIWNGTCCPTDSVAIWGATTGQTFCCRWMD